jgi:hypothetical protein
VESKFRGENSHLGILSEFHRGYTGMRFGISIISFFLVIRHVHGSTQYIRRRGETVDSPLPPYPPFGSEIVEAGSNDILRDSMSLYTDDSIRPVANPVGPVYEEFPDQNELSGDISLRRDSMSLHDIPAGPVDGSLSDLSSIHALDETYASIDMSGMNDFSADETLDNDADDPDFSLSEIEENSDYDSEDSVFDLLNEGFLDDSYLTDHETTLDDVFGDLRIFNEEEYLAE